MKFTLTFDTKIIYEDLERCKLALERFEKAYAQLVYDLGKMEEKEQDSS